MADGFGLEILGKLKDVKSKVCWLFRNVNCQMLLAALVLAVCFQQNDAADRSCLVHVLHALAARRSWIVVALLFLD